MSDTRWDLVQHIREQIKVGTYTTPGKLRIASEKLARILQRIEIEWLDSEGDSYDDA